MIRIIAGENKGARLISAPGSATRPTLARVRESLFSILGERVIDALFIDLYAGNGAIGIEALSRGAQLCVFVEQSRHALAALRSNISKLNQDEHARVVSRDVFAWLSQCEEAAQADVIFLDPPYERGLGQKTLEVLGNQALRESCVVIVQCGARESLPDDSSLLSRFRLEKYGDTCLHFYAAKVTAD